MSSVLPSYDNKPLRWSWKVKSLTGQLLGYVARYDNPINPEEKKVVIPYFKPDPLGFGIGFPEEPWPLFGLETLSKTDVIETCYIAEGEKTTQLLHYLDMPAVSSIGGTKNLRKADLSPLVNLKRFCIFQDNDEPGIQYRNEFTELLWRQNRSAAIFFVDFPYLPEAGDIADMVQGSFPWWNGFSPIPDSNKKDVQSFVLKLAQGAKEAPKLAGTGGTTISNPTAEWPEPEQLKNTLLEVPEFDLNYLPECFQAYARDLAERMPCRIDYVAVALMVVTGSIIGSGCTIKPKQRDNWREAANLWGALIGVPSQKKSPALGDVLKFLKPLEEMAEKDYLNKKRDFQACQKLNKERDKVLLEDYRKAVKTPNTEASDEYRKDQNDDLKTLEKFKEKLNALDDLKEPSYRRYRSHDVTVEKLGEILRDNPTGVLLVRDELIGMLNVWEQEDHSADRTFMLEGWNGLGDYTADRIGRGTIRIPRVCISLLGCFTPSKLIRYLEQTVKEIQNDGLLQRFQLMVYPDPLTCLELVDREPNYDAEQRVEEVLLTLANSLFTPLGALWDGGSSIPHFYFDREAQELFNAWYAENQKSIRNEEGNGRDIISQHLGKYPALVSKLALIIHLVDAVANDTKSQISFETTFKAIAFSEYLEKHALRIYGLVMRPERRAACLLAQKIRTGQLSDGFTQRDIKRHDWTSLNDPQIVDSACRELVEAGILHGNTSRDNSTSSNGGRPTVKYTINPKFKNPQTGSSD